MTPNIIPVMVTRVSSDDLVIKIHAVTNFEAFSLIDNILDGYTERLLRGVGLPKSRNDILPGKMVLALRNKTFLRAEIMTVNSDLNKANVNFIDVGGLATVSISDIRRVEDVPHLTVANVPQEALAVECILFGAVKYRQWSAEDLNFINVLASSCRMQAHQVGEIQGLSVLNVVMTDTCMSLSDALIEKQFAIRVQLDQLKKIMDDKCGTTTPFNTPPPTFNSTNVPSRAIPIVKPPTTTTPNSFQYQPPPGLPTPPIFNQPAYIPMMAAASVPNYTRLRAPQIQVQQSNVPQQYRPATLQVGSEHKVHVSYVIDGAQAFTVQLKNDVSSKLQTLMASINDGIPEPFTDPLIPGTVCLGRFSEDQSLCRAVVTTVIGDNANLYFVDFGNSEVVPFTEIYKIPPAFIRPECMAIRFSLANANEYALSTQEAMRLFEEIVHSADELLMQVTKPESPLKQYCELFIHSNGKLINVKTKILNKVKMMKPVEYHKIQCKQGNTADVTVTFAESPHRFFVQFELNQSILEMLMLTVADYCATAEHKEILYVEDVNENMAVCAQYSEDGQWYRGLITDEPDPQGNVNVLFVDYGNAEKAHFSKLRVMNNEMISKFPVQAVECRLDVDAELALKEDVIDYFIDLVNGEPFVLKVLNVLPAHVLLVNLLDQNGKSITEHLVQKFTPVKEVLSESFSNNNKSPSSQGNWRDRRSSSNADRDFSAFKRGEGGRSDNVVADETDNVRANEYRQYPSREQGPRKYDRNDSEQSGDRPWKKGSDNDSGGRSFKPREDRWNNKADGGGNDGYNNRDENRGFRSNNNWQSQDNSGEGGRTSFKPRGEGGWQGRDNEGNSNPRPYKPRAGGWNNNRDNDADTGRSFKPHGNDDWQSTNNDGGGRRQFKPREDRYGDSKPYQNRNSKPWMEHDDRVGEKTNDWGAQTQSSDSYKSKPANDWSNNNSNSFSSKTTNDWSNNRSNDNWSSKRNDESANDWNGNKGGDTWSKKENDSHDGGNRRSDGDNWGGKRENRYGQRNNNDYGGQNKWGSGGGFEAKTRDPTYEKGGLFVETEYKVNQELEVVVSWFINPTQFFVMPAENSEFLQLMEKVQTDYANREPLDLNSLSTGDCLMAQDKEDTIYRARFLRGRPGGAIVTFVDYGNSETVKKDHAWAVSQDHCNIPIQAVCCSLNDISPIDENTPWSKVEGLENYFGRDKYTLTFVKCQETNALKTWSVNLKNEDNEDIGALLVADGLAVSNTVLTSEQLYDPSLLCDQVFAVFSGAVISSKKFYVHIEPDKAEKIRVQISKLCETPESMIALPAEEIVEGGFCLACSEDGEYYRALILEVDETNKTAAIVYIDYGDENEVAFDAIKILPNDLIVYNSQVMECCLYECESFEDEDAFVEALTEKDFIIKVMDVVDNKLHVIVYDIEGTRMPFPVPVEEKVPVLCSLPIVKNYDSVVIPHIDANKVYLQRVVDETLITDLSERLTEKYDADKPEKVILEPDQFYAAKSGKFLMWYRCKACNSDCQEVFYIDYGNTEKLDELIALKPLDADFFNYPMYCVSAATGVYFTAEDLNPLIDVVQDVVFDAAFESVAPNEWSVDLKCEKTGKTLAAFAVETNCGSEKPSEAANVVPYNAFEKWQLGEEQQVHVSHINSPENFYIQSADDVSKITSLQKNLQTSLKCVLPLIGPYDQMIAAQNPADNKWYRVRKVTKEEVFAIDFGFTITNPRVKRLPKKFTLDKSNYITLCSLNVQPTANAWTQESISTFSQMVSDGSNVTAKLEFIKCDLKYIDVTVDSVLCADKLTTTNMARFKSHAVTISHVTSLQDFYVQFLENESIFNLVESLTEAETWETVEPKIGEIVVAQFTEDEQWYRAEILNKDGDVITAKFIDYGNEAPCTQFRVIPDELKSLPRYAMQCRLQQLPENADELKETFVNFVAQHIESTFSIYIIKTGEPCLVLLEFNNQFIEDILSSQSTDGQIEVQPAVVGETVIVSHINSPSSFYVQSETAPLDKVATALANVQATAPLTECAVGDLVAAIFPEDETWYRARIVHASDASTNALFVDCGNESPIFEVRALPEEARNVPYLAKHCAFPVPAEQQEWPEVANARFSELICEGNTVFKITIKEDGNPAIVDLQDEGISVADELATLCKADLTAPVHEATKDTVLISHANSLNSIWVQYQTPQLDEMSNEMAMADTFDDLTTAEVGSLVAAKFEEEWYRAKVLSRSEDGVYNVLFIDYGNESEATSIKSLPEDLEKLAPLTEACRLKNLPDDVESWPAGVMDKVLELVAEAKVFVLNELIKSEGACVASLAYSEGGEDLSESLIKYKDELEGGKSTDADKSHEEPLEEPVEKESEDKSCPKETESNAVEEVVDDKESEEKSCPKEIGSTVVEEVESVSTEATALYFDADPKHFPTLHAPVNTPEKLTPNLSPERDAQQSGHSSTTQGSPDASVEETQQLEALSTITDLAEIPTDASAEDSLQKKESTTASGAQKLPSKKAELSEGEIEANAETLIQESEIEVESASPENKSPDELVEASETCASSKVATEEEIGVIVDKAIEEKPAVIEIVPDNDKSRDQQNTVTEDAEIETEETKPQEETSVESNDKEIVVETDNLSSEKEHGGELPETCFVEETNESSKPEIEEKSSVDVEPASEDEPLMKSPIEEGNGVVDVGALSQEEQLGTESVSDNDTNDPQPPAEDETDDRFETPSPMSKSNENFATPEGLDVSTEESTLNSSVYEPPPPATEKTDDKDELSDGDAGLLFEENEFHIAHIDSPSSFYLHTTSDKKRLRAIEKRLKMTNTAECEITSPEVGEVAATKINGTWLRVRVLEIDDRRGSVVQCLDYGNVTSSSVLYSLDEELLQIPPLVHHCGFRMPQHISTWPEKVCEEFEEEMLLNNPTIRVEVVDSVDELKIVNMFSGQEDITAKMISMCPAEK